MLLMERTGVAAVGVREERKEEGDRTLFEDPFGVFIVPPIQREPECVSKEFFAGVHVLLSSDFP